MGKRAWLMAAVLQAFSLTAQAALNFPALTGRVVDNAQMIDPAVRAQLTQQLQALEQTSGDQIVVVTVPDLQGVPIEDFGYQLGRAWGIGQKGKDNGALLIVARDEHKIRIEVGYGLEGMLTDAQSWVIINQVIAPAFKAGNYSKGISDGVAAMLQVVGGDPLAVPAHVSEANFAKQTRAFPLACSSCCWQCCGCAIAWACPLALSSWRFSAAVVAAGEAVEVVASGAAAVVLAAVAPRAAGNDNN